MKKITFDELADIYDKETGGKARIRPMEKVTRWAEQRKDLFHIDEEGFILKKEGV